MGNSVSKSIYNPPHTFRECFDDGILDIGKYFIYRRRVEENEDAMEVASKIYCDIAAQQKRKADLSSSLSSKKRRVHTRSVKRHAILDSVDINSPFL